MLLPHVSVGRRAVVRRCILDENCIIPDDMQIGIDPAEDARRFYVTKGGIVLVTQDMLRALTA